MSTFGCHSCGVNIEDYKDKPWEEVPCATCKLSKDYTGTFRAAAYDSGKMDEDEQFAKLDKNITAWDEKEIDPDTIASVKSLKLLKEVFTEQILLTMSGIIIKLVKMAKTNPTLFEVVIKKMQYPYMSYTEIGESMTPKCSKQNVLYHLKHALATVPELGPAILTDTRFSAGRYAIRTIADRDRKNLIKRKMSGLLFSDDPMFQEKGLHELNSMLKIPLTVPDSVLNFNQYIKDEQEDMDED